MIDRWDLHLRTEKRVVSLTNSGGSSDQEGEFSQITTCSTRKYGDCELFADAIVTPAIFPVASIRQNAVPAFGLDSPELNVSVVHA